MKVPLRYQISEYDCAKATLENALCYLYDRELVPASLIKIISKYSLDIKNGFGGTSRHAIKSLTKRINNHSEAKKMGLKWTYLHKKEVTLENLVNCKGIIAIRCYQTKEHFVLITKMDLKNAYLFDPYYLPEDFINKDNFWKLEINKIFDYNRIVKIERLMEQSQLDFAMGSINKRECILIEKENA